MKYQEIYNDYQYLYDALGGGPFDSGEHYERIGEDLLQNPTKTKAKKHLVDLIQNYFYRGGPDGEMPDENDSRVLEIRKRYVD